MSDLKIKRGTVSKIIRILIGDSSVTTGAGKTGLTNASSSLIAYYIRSGDASPTVISLSAGTVGTWSSGGFKEVDATHMPGLYEIGLPNAMLASGESVTLFLSGVTNMRQTVREIELDAVDYQDAVSFGLSGIIGSAVKKNTALAAFPFFMFDSATHQLITSLTVTAQRSIDGGAFANCANSVVEVSAGEYKIDLAAADLNGTTIGLKFTATGADDQAFTILTHL